MDLDAPIDLWPAEYVEPIPYLPVRTESGANLPRRGDAR